jgi:hypothetical protein
MTHGEKLLKLNAEYLASTDSREDWGIYGAEKVSGREPSEIAVDHEGAIRELVQS